MGASAFEREIHVSFTEGLPGAHFVKHYDRRHVGLRPFDFEVFYQGSFFALEAKHAAGRLDLRRFHPHQREALARVVENGGYSYLLIRIEDPKKSRKKFRAFAISPHRLLALAEALGKVSVNAVDLAEGAAGAHRADYEARRVKFGLRYGWDFAFFIAQRAEATGNLQSAWDEDYPPW